MSLANKQSTLEMQDEKGAAATAAARVVSASSSAAAVAAAALSSSSPVTMTSDLYSQLEQKDHDLVLAAELGKALLDKNEELSRQNEKIAEDFSVKLEVGPVQFGTYSTSRQCVHVCT